MANNISAFATRLFTRSWKKDQIEASNSPIYFASKHRFVLNTLLELGERPGDLGNGVDFEEGVNVLIQISPIGHLKAAAARRPDAIGRVHAGAVQPMVNILGLGPKSVLYTCITHLFCI
jgi:hypothetical protein